MDDFARLYALNRVEKRREQRTIVFQLVLLNVDDDNPEAQLFEVVFVFKTAIDGHQNVTLALRLSNQLGVGKGAPLGLRDGQDFMIGESLP